MGHHIILDGWEPGCLGVPAWSSEEVAFIRAMDRYRTLWRRPFPTCREVLAVLHSLGYRKVAAPGPLPRPRCRRGHTSQAALTDTSHLEMEEEEEEDDGSL